MQAHSENDGDKVPGLYRHKAGAVGTPATPGNIIMTRRKCSILEAMICSFILQHLLSLCLLSLVVISMSSLQTHIQLSLRLSLPL